MSTKAKLRRLWLNVHLWIGVGLFVLLVPLGVSGSLIMVQSPIDRAIHPHRFAVSQGPLLAPSAYLEAGRAAFGDRATPTSVRMPAEAWQPVTVVGRIKGRPAPGQRPQSLTAWIDPPTGKVLDVANIQNGFTGTIHRLHGALLIPMPLGRQIVGWMGLAMFINCATGLWLWWPRNGRFLIGLRWRRSPSTLNNLHHLVGFWICLPLAVLSLTGAYISFPQTMRMLTGQPAQAAPRQPAGGPGRNAPPLARTATGLDAAVQAALAARPGLSLDTANLPTRGDAPAWRIQLRKPGAERPVSVNVDDRTGEVQAAERREAQPSGPGGGDPVLRWVRETHEGEGLSPVWWAIVFIAGWTPAILGVTGVIMWLRRRALRRALRHGHGATA